MANTKKTECYLSFSDLLVICKRHKRKILLIALLGCLFGIYYAVSRPVEFQAVASFREKGKSQSGISQNSLTSLLLNNSGTSLNSEAISIFKSHTLLSELIKNHDLQARLNRRESKFETFERILDNLFIEYSNLNSVKGPLFLDHFPVVAVKDVTYDGEQIIDLRIRFISEEAFHIVASDDVEPLEGSIGKPFAIKNASFIIEKIGNQPIAWEEYELTLLPLSEVIKEISARLIVESDKEDKALLKLKLKYPNRQKAAELLNSMMAIYQSYLQDEQQRIMAKQIDYLNERHDEVLQKLQEMMKEHATNLSLDVATTGFPDTVSAMDFFARTQQQYAKELLGIDLELKRLLQVKNEDKAQFESIQRLGNHATINQFLEQIHHLKQQSDLLAITLQENVKIGVVDDISDRLQLLDEIKGYEVETEKIVADLNSNRKLNPDMQLLQTNNYRVKNWYEKLLACNGKAESEQCTAHFKAYLTNLRHLFHVHAKSLQDQLAHQQNSSHDFQGIDLKTAKELYLNYSRDLNALEAHIRQTLFIIAQLKEETFEISSLSGVLEDTVSRNIINRASELVLAIRDHNNRSTKELERFKEDLSMQKGFLALHLEQTAQLLQLREKLLKDKIHSLQRTTLSLMQQESSVLQEHLADHIQFKIDSLSQDRSVIEQHQRELQQEMARLPSKWVTEKMIDQQMELDKKMVEEVTKLVESKNISSNLEIIQSAPLDEARIPVQPQPPRIVLFAFGGAFLGALFASTYAVGSTIARGIPITEKNLTLSGKKVAGSLTKANSLSSKDLSTLRRLTIFLTSQQLPLTTVLITGGGDDYSKELARLMQKRNLKVLLLPLFFNQASNKEGGGLLQYLEGKIERPEIFREGDHHLILPGGTTQFSYEMLNSNRFVELLDGLKGEYDWICAISPSKFGSAESDSLLKLFSSGVITVTDQTWNDLALHENENIYFIMKN